MYGPNICTSIHVFLVVNVPSLLVNVLFLERNCTCISGANHQIHPFKVGAGETLTPIMLLQKSKQ
jgi:hypothetical protein